MWEKPRPASRLAPVMRYEGDLMKRRGANRAFTEAVRATPTNPEEQDVLVARVSVPLLLAGHLHR